jgi:spermidine synthase
LKEPHVVLRGKADTVAGVDDSIRELVADLADTLYSTTGVGLAAPQIGSGKAVIIVDANRDHSDPARNYYALINPRIIRADGIAMSANEGCKSLPGVRVDVPRASRVVIDAIDTDGHRVRKTVEGYEAIVLQHEIDHLNGVLITDNRAASPAHGAKVNPADGTADANVIRARLEPFRSMPDGLLVSQRTRTGHILVVKDGVQIILYFGDPRDTTAEMKVSGIMSRISIDDPIRLLGLYTRVMMLSLAWCQNPGNVYMLGFGGGRVPMALRHYIPGVIIESTETEATVVQLAQRYFGITLDDHMRVAVEDGRKYLARRPADTSYEIIMVDCFSGSGQHPYRLSTIEFYDLCKRHLKPGGVVVTNFSSADPLIDEKVATFASAFATTYVYEEDVAFVMFGSEGPELTQSVLIDRAQSVAKALRPAIPLAEYAAALKRVSRGDDAMVLSDKDAERRITVDDPAFLGVERNQACPCGSGKKFKKCHGARAFGDQAE